MSGKMQKYADATLFDLTRVIDAADRLYASVAEFPDDPACWADWMDALDTALESCHGTSAHYHKQQREKEGCHVCGGDCASANPPVLFCPMRSNSSTESHGST